jgi:hypothetical protein
VKSYLAMSIEERKIYEANAIRRAEESRKRRIERLEKRKLKLIQMSKKEKKYHKNYAKYSSRLVKSSKTPWGTYGKGSLH